MGPGMSRVGCSGWEDCAMVEDGRYWSEDRRVEEKEGEGEGDVAKWPDTKPSLWALAVERC